MGVPSIFLYLLLRAVAVAGTPQQPSSSETCVGMPDHPGNKTARELPSIHIVNNDSTAPFVLPKGTPSDVTAILCARNTLVPEKYDFKILLAGFPLAIVAPDNRKATLELSPQHIIIYRMIEGTISNEENILIQGSLQANQRLLTRAASK